MNEIIKLIERDFPTHGWQLTKLTKPSTYTSERYSASMYSKEEPTYPIYTSFANNKAEALILVYQRAMRDRNTRS